MENLKKELIKHFGDNGEQIKIVQAPGRVNLIGEHTDYNDGFVLPIAIDREITIAVQPREDKLIKIYSLNYSTEASFDLTNIQHNDEENWINYPQGVAKMLLDSGYELRGMNLVLTGNVPQGAGLSSSAALEVATALTFQLINGFELDRVAMAKLCQQAENKFVGVNCGIMDQFISALGKKDNALFVDCRSNEYQLVPIKTDEIKIVVANTNVEHSLVDSAYNQRLKECAQAVKIFDELLSKEVIALRDVSVAEFEEYKAKLPELIRNRAKHVIYENKRVQDTITAFKENNLSKVGELMIDSHQSLRDLYEVSCDELDYMVELALELDGVLGSRMTGAGFGGCTVNLVKEDAVELFKEKVSQGYLDKTGVKADIYICNIEDGAHELIFSSRE
ncbi:galactokinase [Orenia metallireducens]|uniref:Galactokinase n=1 Tax=Orenia metallireducens TaxID=1413210 RepID=A0A1C0ADG3_9FIRM|nr:galactokinase [Orenia metallireducens]OCL28745.1 galactokinase [Orenia metallireducens]